MSLGHQRVQHTADSTAGRETGVQILWRADRMLSILGNQYGVAGCARVPAASAIKTDEQRTVYHDNPDGFSKAAFFANRDAGM